MHDPQRRKSWFAENKTEMEDDFSDEASLDRAEASGEK